MTPRTAVVPAFLFAMAMASLLGIVTGCAETRKYQVAVRNETKRPVMIWLTKDGPPEEAGWLSPEEFARSSPGQMEPIPGAVLQPGEELETDLMKGKFDPETNAILRVYDGQMRFAEILATPRHERLEVALREGTNELVVIDDETGRIAVERARR